MTDALIFNNREGEKAKLDLDFARVTRLADNMKVVFPSYFVNFWFFQLFLMLRVRVASHERTSRLEPVISLATANMAIV
jgi:hypothetical protein